MIYISETDIFASGLAWDEVIQTFRRAGTAYDDGCHMICANAEVNESDLIFGPMSCFKRAGPDDMNHGELSRRLRFMKREAGGEEVLCKISEGLIQEGKRQAKLENILALMETTGWDADKAMEMLKIEHEDRPAYAAFIKTAADNTARAQA